MPGIEGKLLLLSTSYVILAILSTRRTPTVISAPQTRVTGLAPRRIKNRHDRWRHDDVTAGAPESDAIIERHVIAGYADIQVANTVMKSTHLLSQAKVQ